VIILLGLAPSTFLFAASIPYGAKVANAIAGLDAYGLLIWTLTRRGGEISATLAPRACSLTAEETIRLKTWYGVARLGGYSWGLALFLAAQETFEGLVPVIGISFDTAVFDLGFFAYFTWLIYQASAAPLARVEDQAFRAELQANAVTVQVELYLEAGHKGENKIEGTLGGIGPKCLILRSDGYKEEVEWGDIVRLGVKDSLKPVQTVSPTPAPQ
jgi:hypothetical protein